MHGTGRLLRKTSSTSLLLEQLREPATYRFHFDSAHLFTSSNNFPCLHRTQVSVNEVDSDCELSKCGQSANWCLCCPGSCTTQIDCLLTGALLSTGLPTFQASRPPAFLPPAPGLLPTTCTAPPPYVESTGPRASYSGSSLLALHVKRWHNFQESKAKEEESQSWHPGSVAGPVPTSHFSYSLHSDRTGLLIL